MVALHIWKFPKELLIVKLQDGIQYLSNNPHLTHFSGNGSYFGNDNFVLRSRFEGEIDELELYPVLW